MNGLPDDELGWPCVQRYLALRAARRIGAVWPGRGGIYWLAPTDAFDPWAALGPISVAKLRDLIDELDRQQIKSDDGALAPPKISVGSARGAWLRERRA